MLMAMGDRQADFLLFNLGRDARWGTDAYFVDHWFTKNVCRFVAGHTMPLPPVVER